MLPVKLTAEELAEKGNTLAAIINEIEDIEGEKKEASDEFNARLKTKRAECSLLANAIESGEEDREIECQWEWNKPKKNWMQLRRLDDDTIIEKREMNELDKEEMAEAQQLKMELGEENAA